MTRNAVQWRRPVRKKNGDVRKQFLQWVVPALERRQYGLKDGDKLDIAVQAGDYSSEPASYVLTSGGEFRLSQAVGEEVRSSSFRKLTTEIVFTMYFRDTEPAQSINLRRAREEAGREGAFDPRNDTDARNRILASIVRRQGQPRFRNELLRAYGKRCAVSGCDCLDVLEAAHIRPYKGPQTNHVRNGLLLRSDIHTLLDLRKIAIGQDYRVTVCVELQATAYRRFNGKRLHLPRDRKDWPDLSKGLL